MSSYHQRQEVDAIIRDTINKVLDFSCSALAALQIPSASNLMTLYATLPPLSLFLIFYCSRNFEACELNLFLSTQLSKSAREVSKFASVALVDIDSDEIQVYVKYFDITFIPSTVFFFNAHHMKIRRWILGMYEHCFFVVSLSCYSSNRAGLKISDSSIISLFLVGRTADHTKWVGTFHKKQDFIDVEEAIYRGAMKGKLIVSCPLPPERIPKYQL
ncbi:thioredoxin-like protein 4b [Quercus suber]|uniref:Thioredoxin-like protein 4b n=1 Tax=Quercus suber TaxID=58331 RepID=A0AAW0IDY2_QUESU